MLSSLQACSKVCAYVSRQVEHVRKSMDGKNVDTVLTELGIRFHRLIHEHLQQYSYSSMGGMLAICDVAEYRRCAKDFRVSGGQRFRRRNIVCVYTGKFKIKIKYLWRLFKIFDETMEEISSCNFSWLKHL